MINLPKIQRNKKQSQELCRCRPVCKNRRREWKGQIQNTSAELLLENKPRIDCTKRWPKLSPDSPCPLTGRVRGVKPNIRKPETVRICQAPIEAVDMTYLNYLEMAKKLGALRSIRACCAFCRCGSCCPCTATDYTPRDAERIPQRRSDMRLFDRRVKTDCMIMRIMYD